MRTQRTLRGSALMVVLAVIVIISLSMAGVLKLAQHRNEESMREAKEFKARQIAESGLALGSHPDIEPKDPILHQELTGGYRLDVKITSEQGRIHINNVTEDWMIRGLNELFVYWGVTADDAAIAADSLVDWIDTDEDPGARGAENDFYAQVGYEQFPPNEDFVSLEQMLLVRGMDAVAKAQPNWRNFFTVYGDGKIDAGTASVDVMHAFAGVPLSDAQRFVTARDGADGELGTEDDGELPVDDAVELLGIPPERRGELGEIFTLEGTAVRIESKATVGDLEFTLVLVRERESGNDLTRYWR